MRSHPTAVGHRAHSPDRVLCTWSVTHMLHVGRQWARFSLAWVFGLASIHNHAAPQITLQPESRAVPEGGSAALFVRATGVRYQGYQWQRNKVDLPNQNGPVLRLSNVTSNDAAIYRVEMTGTDGLKTLSTDAFIHLLPQEPQWSFSVIKRFTGGAEGGRPASGMIEGSDGRFYGTTSAGGSDGYGTVYAMSETGSLQTLYNFTGRADGGEPKGMLLESTDGWFYGTTSSFGASAGGTIFRIRPTGEFESVYSFTGRGDGGLPRTGLAVGGDGAFYGTTYIGGGTQFEGGTVFRFVPGSPLQTLARFSQFGSSGRNPEAEARLSVEGLLYVANSSAIFRISATGVFGPLPAFNNSFSSLGRVPAEGTSGFFYGIASDKEFETMLVQMSKDGVTKVIGAFPNYRASAVSDVVRGPDDAFYLVGSREYGDPGRFYRFTTNGVVTEVEVLDNLAGLYANEDDASLSLTRSGNLIGTVRNATRDGFGFAFILRSPGSKPVITTPPASLRRMEGGSAVFSVAVEGPGPFQYQWRRSGVDIPGAIGPILTLDRVSQADSGSYTVVVSNDQGSTTSAAGELIVPDDIALRFHPVLYIADIPGSRYRIEVSLSAAEPQSWQKLTDIVLTANPHLFIDTSVDARSHEPRRFYRAIPLD